MHQLKIASVFGAILIAVAAIVVTMGALLLQFTQPGNHETAWRSVVIALVGVGVALCLICLLHLGIVAVRLGSRFARNQAVGAWLGRWADIAAGDTLAAPTAAELTAASEAAAQILQDFGGEGAARIRTHLLAWGLVDRDLLLADGKRGPLGVAHVEALERLAWLAVPAAMPLFLQAAGSGEVRRARAGLLGACRTLGAQAEHAKLGHLVVASIESHAERYGASAGYRAFLSAALSEAGPHLTWLCSELLARAQRLPEPVCAAALDALGDSLPDGAEAVVAEALRGGLAGETLAAALRAVARLGHVPAAALAEVLAASGQAHAGARVQVAHALVGADPTLAVGCLWNLLGDRTFEVRFAAASALAECGPTGAEALRRAAATHPDAFARDMAAMLRYGHATEELTSDLAKALLTLSGTQVAVPAKA